MTVVLCVLLLLALISGCVHKTPFQKEYYFQAMGDPSEIVVTVDVSHPHPFIAQHLSQQESFSHLLQRVDRLSVALYDPHGNQESSDPFLSQQDLQSYQFYGAIEGNIPAFLTNSALLWDDQWTQITEDGIRYYRNEYLGLELYAPKNGILLFSQTDFVPAYRKTYSNREIKIPLPLAHRLASSLFGFYIASPQAIVDVGLAIPKTVLLQTESILLVIEEQKDEGVALGGIITMKTAKLANSLSILLKSSYISNKRRAQEPFGDLTNLIVLEDSSVVINGMDLSEEQLAMFSTLFGSLLSMPSGGIR